MAKPRPKEVQYCSTTATGMPPQKNTSSIASDPYLELELYLEKVNEEIGAVFEQWHHESGEENVTSPRRCSEPANLPTSPQLSYPDVVRQGEGAAKKRAARIQGRKASAPILRSETNHLAEFEQVVADELLALTPSPSESSGANTPSPTPLQAEQPVPRLLPDLLSVQQHDLVSDTPKAAATSPVLAPKEVENFLRKVEHTILGQDDNSSLQQCNVKTPKRNSSASVKEKSRVTEDTSGLDAGTQTQGLSRSSSFTWLSSSSLLDSPASASGSSGPSSSTREESSAEDTSSSNEALLAKSANGSSTLRRCNSPDSWLKLRMPSGVESSPQRHSEWAASSEPVWEPRSDITESLDALELLSSSRDGAASDNEMPSQRKRKHFSARSEDSEAAQQATPSPSLSSLRTVGTPLAPELGTKSSSAPVLAKQPPRAFSSTSATTTGNEESDTSRNYTPARSQSERHLSEIEAAEACRWMRAAGFPQYAQMYEDFQFPVDLHAVQKDHPFLDRDALQALFRRLHALNKCARLRIDSAALTKKIDDSDDEVECALSDNWTFLHQSRRWSRVSPLSDSSSCSTSQQQQQPTPSEETHESGEEASGGVVASHVTTAEDDDDDEQESDPMTNPIDDTHPLHQYSSLPPGKFKTTSGSSDSEFTSPQTFRRSGSEKLRDGAKAFLRRVESLKTRGKKHKTSLGKGDENRVIGNPQVIDVAGMQERMRSLNCVDVLGSEATTLDSKANDESSCTTTTTNPQLTVTVSSSTDTSPQHFPLRSKSCIRRSDKELEESGTQSDTDCLQWSTEWLQEEGPFAKDTNSNNTKMGAIASHSEPRRKSTRKRNQQQQQWQEQQMKSATLGVTKPKSSPLSRHGKSDDGGLAERGLENDTTSILYASIDRSAMAKLHKKAMARGFSDVSTREEDSSSTSTGVKQKACVMRWHSFGRGSGMRQPNFLQSSPESPERRAQQSVQLTHLSCGQLMVLRQLAMLKLTALMERHCPALRSTGFTWELPKFMRKCRTPQSKDSVMFGVSLLNLLQQTGHALPLAIQGAIQHLSDHALDRVGLFRKPGVKSRIQKLRTQLISTGLDQPLELTLEEQQAYDVADLVKQFFRELPEALLTNKLSDTFLAIFQHVPVGNRYEAMRWALLLLPDQHREVLQSLLSFLSLVASNSQYNQMTASNLAVCLAPSLFHLSPSSSSADSSLSDSQRSASPRSRCSKRKVKMPSVGSPDAKELTESRAAHDCLHYLIQHHEDLLSVSHDLLTQCHFSSMEQSIPVSMAELGTDLGQDWKGYMHACTTALLKEARDKQRGWVGITSPDPEVDISYKKVGDGHPLRLWRVSTEVEAPPVELLHHIMREQQLWDPTLIACKVLSQPETLSEVYQYVSASMKPLPPRDYCVLRCWRSDLARGGCVLVETSVEAAYAVKLVPNTVRAIVLASRYLLEPCGSGRSRLLHLSRVDTKGRSLDWYNKCYGQMCALNLARIRESFSHTTDGPESKV